MAVAKYLVLVRLETSGWRHYATKIVDTPTDTVFVETKRGIRWKQKHVYR